MILARFPQFKNYRPFILSLYLLFSGSRTLYFEQNRILELIQCQLVDGQERNNENNQTQTHTHTHNNV